MEGAWVAFGLVGIAKAPLTADPEDAAAVARLSIQHGNDQPSGLQKGHLGKNCHAERYCAGIQGCQERYLLESYAHHNFTYFLMP